MESRWEDQIPHDAPSGGQTLAQMQESLTEIPGLTITTPGGGTPNVKGNTGYDFTVEVQPGHAIVDGPALVDFLVRSAWSVRDGWMPNAQISISVQAEPGSGFDIGPTAAEGGWVAPRDWVVSDSGYSRVPIPVDESKGAENRERLGPWPGEVPAVPANVTAPAS
ncbi:hypothetical protein [Microbacterium sp. Marseille-Q6965]|uniref:hypothetical protein n=1 Tax=Microbacterium sp. Marseille-Q6965 TaxID=2965072 RepID=UPI0021B8066A|nr:hypothetical protein [Microbacterium sp. Marseille-Q6965]